MYGKEVHGVSEDSYMHGSGFGRAFNEVQLEIKTKNKMYQLIQA